MKQQEPASSAPQTKRLTSGARLAEGPDPASLPRPEPDDAEGDALDIVGLIAAANAGRDPVLLSRKFNAISADAFAFLRATAVIGHSILDLHSVPASPLAWVTGDLHVENYGTFKGENGLVYFDLNDFDESARLPLSVDLVRLLASMVAAGRALKFDSAARKMMLETVLSRIGAVLAKGKSTWVERETARGTVRVLIDRAGERRRRELLAEHTSGTGAKRRLRIDGKGLLAFDSLKGRFPFEAIKQAVEARMKEREDEIEILDIARRVAGKGGLGLPRFALLARRRWKRETIILDLKFAAASSPAARFGLQQPAFASEAERIVAIQELCQAVSPADLTSCVVGKDSFVLRMLQPQEDKVDLVGLAKNPAGLVALFSHMGEIHAASLLRSAGRLGSAGPDDLIAFGQGLGGQAQAWIDAAINVEAEIRDAYKVFRRAWKDRDPRLIALTKVSGVGAH